MEPAHPRLTARVPGPRQRTTVALRMDRGAPDFTTADVEEFLGLCADLGIPVWLDGGWGIDALVGEQTRPHTDLDIVIEQRDTPTLRGALAALGFEDVSTADRRAWNFVMAHRDGRRVDFHVIVFDRAGNGTYGPAEHGASYPAAALGAVGVVAGREVRCLSAEFQMESHTGYELGTGGLHDVALLHERLGVPLHPEHRDRLGAGG